MMKFNPYSLLRFVPLSLLRGFARLAAWLIYSSANSKINNNVRKNLILSYPNLSQTELNEWQKIIIKNQCFTTVEAVKSWAMSPEWSINQIKEVHNKEIFLEGLSNPKGMLAIVPHLGNWEMLNAWVSQHGSQTIMYKPVRNKLANDFIVKGRKRLNTSLVPTDASGVKTLFKILKNGGFTVLLPDHVPDKSGGEVVPFFGVPTLSSTLASKLASKTQCDLVGISCIRRPDNSGFDIHFYRLDNPDLYAKDIKVASAAMNASMQSMIEPFSHHYMWGYRRFKFVPGIENIYETSDEALLDYRQSLNDPM